MRDNVINLKVCYFLLWCMIQLGYAMFSFVVCISGSSSQWRCSQDRISCSKECCGVCSFIFHILLLSFSIYLFVSHLIYIIEYARSRISSLINSQVIFSGEICTKMINILVISFILVFNHGSWP